MLAYELYLRAYSAPLRYPGPADGAVAELSALLRELPLYATAARADPRFRNPAGVARKIQNLMWAATGGRQGSPHLSATDRRVASEVGAAEAAAISAAIRTAVRSSDLSALAAARPATPEAEAVEGELLYRWHAARERSRPLVRAKKEAARTETGALACEACGDQLARYGPSGPGVFECHHKLPLSAGVRQTRLEDLAIVCPTCHRVLHAGRRWPSVRNLAASLEASRG